MKKILLAIIPVFALLMIHNNHANAQRRTKISNGVYLVAYGNTFVIEDDNSQQSISLSVEKHEDKSNHPVYDLLCGNKYTKGLAKTALKGGITLALTKAGAALGAAAGGLEGAVAGASFGARVSAYANSIASNIYDDVCNYYKDK